MIIPSTYSIWFKAEFEDAKGLIWIRKSETDGQHNGQKNTQDLQNTYTEN